MRLIPPEPILAAAEGDNIESAQAKSLSGG